MAFYPYFSFGPATFSYLSRGADIPERTISMSRLFTPAQRPFSHGPFHSFSGHPRLQS